MKTTVPVPGRFGLPLGFAAGIVATTIAVATGATAHPARSAVLLAVAVAAVAACTSAAAALGTAVLCWCLDDGFVLGRHGGLVATPPAAVAAAVLVGTALLVAAFAAAFRAARRNAAVTAHIPVARNETATVTKH